MKLKHLYIILIILFLIAAIFGIVNRVSYYDNTNHPKMVKGRDVVTYAEFDYNNVFLDGEVSQFDDLYNCSDIIIKACKREEESCYNSGNTVTKVYVEDIYKGSVESDSIYILEPIFYCEEGDYIASIEGYNWIKCDNDYILFLNKYNSYNLCDEEKIYIPSTAKYSKYNMLKAEDIMEDIAMCQLYYKLWSEITEKYK